MIENSRLYLCLRMNVCTRVTLTYVVTVLVMLFYVLIATQSSELFYLLSG